VRWRTQGRALRCFERRPYVGGRASSYEHPGTGEVVDNCQHVLLGCCTNLIDFYQRLGVSDKIRWFRCAGRLLSPVAVPVTFRHRFFCRRPCTMLPPFFRAKMLNLKDKFAIARAMAAMSRTVAGRFRRDLPLLAESTRTNGNWRLSGSGKPFWSAPPE